MRKRLAVLMVATMLGLWFVPRPAQAQEESKEASPATAPKAKPPLQPYRLDFSFNEVLEGKIVNTRHYTMALSGTGEPSTVKIGTRVPVTVSTSGPGTANTQYQYLDVGTDLFAQLRERGDDWQLVVKGEVSNLDLETAHPGELAPVIRQIKINGDTLLVIGKPILIGSVDDPNSKRQFQLEVTVTKLR
jgi:hypothetical protein